MELQQLKYFKAVAAIGKISDASPIGLALIGAGEGDTVVVTVVKGVMNFKVKKVSRAKD